MRVVIAALAAAVLAPVSAHAHAQAQGQALEPEAAKAPAEDAGETLQDALAAAYLANPTLQAARAQARSSDEAIPQARASFLPRANLTGSYTTSETEFDRGGDVVAQGASYRVSVEQSLFSGGGRLAQLRAARASVEGAHQTLREVEQSVLLSAVAAFTNVQRDLEVVRIARNNVAVLTEQLQAARDRFEVGEITRTDVAQAEARLAQADSTLLSAMAVLERSRAEYAEIIGRPPGTLAPVPPAPALPETLDLALEQGLAQNPRLLRQEQTLRAARQQVRVEAANLAPSLSLVGSATRAEDYATSGRDTDGLAATANFSMPLFEGGFTWSRVRQARSNVDRAEEQLEEVRRDVSSQVTAAWFDLAAARRTILSARDQERASALALEGVNEELSVGLRTTLDVLNAQQELLNAQLAIVRAERDAYVAAHVLLQAIGGLNPAALNAPVEAYDPSEHRRAVHWKIIGASPPGRD